MILKTRKLWVDAATHAGPRKLGNGSDQAVTGRQRGGGLPGLVAQQYASRSRGEKGWIRALLRALLGKMSGLSVPQITRLIRQYRLHGTIARKPVRRRRFPTQYTSVEVTLLAQVDRVHRIKAMGTARKASIPSTPSLLHSVAAVTQWENIGCTAKISEIYLMPVREAGLHQFPFRILGFHPTNGSEYINGRRLMHIAEDPVEFDDVAISGALGVQCHHFCGSRAARVVK